MKLDPALAHTAIQAKIAKPLGLEVEEAALGIHRVINAQMAEGMRLVSIRQGFDPRDFSLVALGGAGPMHAIALADDLDMEAVVVPRHPGVLSAEGLLVAPVEHEVSVGFPRRLEGLSVEAVKVVLVELDERCGALMAEEALTSPDVSIRYSADVCFIGQAYWLDIRLNLEAPEAIEQLYQDFRESHDQVYGYCPDSPAKTVNLRTVHRAEGGEARTSSPVVASSDRCGPSERAIRVGDSNAPVAAPVYDRRALAIGDTLPGPAVIEQLDSTTIIHAGWQAAVVEGGHLRLTRRSPPT